MSYVGAISPAFVLVLLACQASLPISIFLIPIGVSASRSGGEDQASQQNGRSSHNDLIFNEDLRYFPLPNQFGAGETRLISWISPRSRLDGRYKSAGMTLNNIDDDYQGIDLNKLSELRYDLISPTKQLQATKQPFDLNLAPNKMAFGRSVLRVGRELANNGNNNNNVESQGVSTLKQYKDYQTTISNNEPSRTQQVSTARLSGNSQQVERNLRDQFTNEDNSR